MIEFSEGDRPTRTELWEPALQTLRRAIISGEIAAGTRLVESELARALGVSRWPVRQAIARLEQEQLVVRYINRGAYAAEFTAQDIRDVYALRRLLECHAIREATLHYRPEVEPELQEAVEQLAACVENDDAVGAVEPDIRFHRTICAIGGSTRLVSMWEMLVASLQALMLIRNTRETPEAQRRGRDAHTRIIDVMRQGDPDEAEREMRNQVDISETSLLAWHDLRHNGGAKPPE